MSLCTTVCPPLSLGKCTCQIMHQTGLFFQKLPELLSPAWSVIFLLLLWEINLIRPPASAQNLSLRKLDALDASLPHAVMLPLASPSQSRLTEREKKERESECLYAYILEWPWPSENLETKVESTPKVSPSPSSPNCHPMIQIDFQATVPAQFFLHTYELVYVTFDGNGFSG